MKTEYLTLDKEQKYQTFNLMANKCVGAGRAKEGLRADWQAHLSEAVKTCGFQYLRFHGLFADDMCVVQLEEDGIHYNWQEIDQLFDFMLDQGIRPFVELGFMPSLLASGETTVFWWKANVTPPKDDRQWVDLISAAINHWVDRYGHDEVVKWYFEVWNEPNLPPFWPAGKKAYFNLYANTVKAIKAVSTDFRVGGPATSNFVPDDRFSGDIEDRGLHKTHHVADVDALSWQGVWIVDFLEFCHKNDLPVDFVSTHPYPTDFALDATSKITGRTRHKASLEDDLTWLKAVVAKSPYPEAEIHLTEWSSSPSSRDLSHDYLPVANYIVKSNIDCHDLTDSLSYWVFTDVFEENGSGPRCFHGGFGMINLQGIKKPSFHAYRFLSQLGSKLLEKGHEHIMTINDQGLLRGIIYNYADTMPMTIPIAKYPDYGQALGIQALGQEKHVTGKMTGFSPGAVIALEILDKDHGTAVTQWHAMGAPATLNRQETTLLKAAGEATLKKEVKADDQGVLTLDLLLGPWAVVLVSELAAE